SFDDCYSHWGLLTSFVATSQRFWSGPRCSGMKVRHHAFGITRVQYPCEERIEPHAFSRETEWVSITQRNPLTLSSRFDAARSTSASPPSMSIFKRQGIRIESVRASIEKHSGESAEPTKRVCKTSLSECARPFVSRL